MERLEKTSVPLPVYRIDANWDKDRLVSVGCTVQLQQLHASMHRLAT